MNKFYPMITQFFLVFFVWVGVQYLLFEPLHYWKTVISGVICSLISVIGWYIILTKIERKIQNERNQHNNVE